MPFVEIYRGAKAGIPRILEKFLLASLALIALTGSFELFYHWHFAIVYLLLFSAGASVSWGSVIGACLRRDSAEKFRKDIKEQKDSGDWYLVGWFAKSPMRGLFARSIVWGVLASAALFGFGYIPQAIVMLVVYSAVMPLSIYFLRAVEGNKFDNKVGNICQKLVDKSYNWPRHEFYRGGIAGLLLLLTAMFI